MLKQKRGFTLIELMVSVVIMVLMMMAFGMIITQAQKVVSVTQNNTRDNNTAQAIAQTIRDDLSKITKNGFLCIGKNPSHKMTPVLIFTTAGINRSKTCELSGLGGVSSYGYAANQAKPAEKILLRQSWVLTTQGDGSADERDIWPFDLSNFQTASRIDINTTVNNLSDSLGSAAIFLPPQKLSHTNDLWKVLTENTHSIGIMWGDVDANGNLNWFGVNSDYEVKNKDAYVGKTITDAVLEYKEIDYGYRALWTHHNQNNWPKAIKIRFRLKNTDEDYEVIVAIE